ncbi:MAG: 4a-hydroxytetrahydrobiopterin dehydratase [Gammaproteobacteria bacterium]|jgi:4a-hydroxytetrahydrobiopterin dehydratase|nr:4a-hydroxytetrahydrobiopterin dehydratase [Gammaproteobacteria bacterium]MBT5222704.1 4a-hydroxytetrahydrobiopterin dehydratase [Gammaproteobacteria bacterium]MBT5825710.1 4a-hydroxytetrahydrobiopterin dehydratase [Gammaproteobacteria bacterium]MBT6421063.1 4a-hydroxytetrahydrobiopterin dehydratase [Gammaproteobacteria bacterium]MBT6575534.1 4a-hydroxytetrahydrobiopterin dehydratase [Gammaproteobacteria bacterium]
MTKAYTEAEIESHLKAELPHWYYENGWIRRKIKTSGWKASLMVVTTVGHLAEKAWHHPDLNVSYAFVIVKLVTHSAKGITDKDFALAKKIEEVVMWDAAATSEGVFEGTPDDPRFKYIKQDKQDK